MELAGMGALLSAGIGLIVVGAVLSYGAELQGDMKDDLGESGCAARTDGFTSYNETATQCYNGSGTHSPVHTDEWNISVDAQDGVAKIGGKLSLIAGIVVIVVVVTMLVRNFKFAG